MAKRKIPFEVDRYYHIFNRGVDKRKIFLDKGDLYYFFDTIIISNNTENIKDSHKSLGRKKIKEKIKEYDSEPLVEIVSYCLLPNHFHFVLKEIKEGGISLFMKKLTGSYSKYFNSKYNRSGTLFQGRFKASILAYENSLERTTAYVNLNYRHHFLDPKKDLVKSSIFEFLGEEKGEKVCSEKEINFILKDAGGVENFKKMIKKYSDEFIKEHSKEELENE